ncbi:MULTISPECIES: hypothetical protein [Mesorhizobium]|nr:MULTISPECIES: hypothetical protein [Mesorhizobium]TPJ40393.1 hypothetical protein FJ437_26095 [Mesorhizobium sp. B2-6-6]ARP67228.1 hypothetical protein A9K65_030750 [Mesorhizobium sp. WSM1497]MCA0002814.1 hypothetical protein [Mesorhizobium sp. B264B2A]MCA0009035.1 hypothetical protein [Mesorhizobium sp. B264B1B]MCA0014568.1 hypothetical protein [Mesorhizobium sp. B294B1A1]
MAAHSTIYSVPDRSVVFLGGVGYTWPKGNEFVYDEGGNRVSKLIWETGAPVLTRAKGRGLEQLDHFSKPSSVLRQQPYGRL